MKKLLIVSLSLAIACTQEPKQQPSTNSTQAYSIPQFQDTASFERMRQFLPVVDQIYKDYAQKNHFAGVSYGIVVGGQLLHTGNVGVINTTSQAPATTQSLFRIASMSKSFTAMAILKLRDEGKLLLSDPVYKYIPEFSQAGKLTGDAPDITILHLLTMSAGFPEDNPWGDRQLDDTDEELLALVRGGISFSNDPGLTFEYSNLGFALLGKIITNVSRMPYQKYITENIMNPIGMTSSRWEYDDIPDDQLAHGYQWDDTAWKEIPLLHDGSYGAMGGLICSIEDFAKYMSLHLSAWPPRTGPDDGPISRSSIREMHQPWRFSTLASTAKARDGKPCPAAGGYGYGLGWAMDCNGKVRISHSGGLPGFGSQWFIYPDYGFGVVSFSNETYGAPSVPNRVAADTLIYLAGLKPRALAPSTILETRKAEIVKLLPDWKEVDESIFAENFFLDESLERRRGSTQKLFETVGAIRSVNALQPENQLRGAFEIECEKGKIVIFFTLTPEREARIQQLDIERLDH